jgi:RND superfamily putative drug exporter
MRRIMIAAVAVTIVWLGIGAWAGPLAGRLSEVAENDNASFLPADAEATRAERLAVDFTARPTLPAVVVYERPGGVTAADRARVAADARAVATIAGVVPPLPPPLPSEDGEALELVVPIDSTAAGGDVDTIVESIRAAVPSRDGLTVHVTGPAGLLADLIAVFKEIDVTLLLVTASIVVLILLVVYRSPVLWLIPLISTGIAFAGAGAAVYGLADAGAIDLNGQAQGILTVLVFGAGTDYALLLIARYREELHRHPDTATAMMAALRAAAPALVASAGTVIASLLCLLLWGRVAALIGRRARTVWVLTTVVLAALSVGLTRLDVSGLSQAEVFTNRPDSVVGQEVLSRHYAAGTGSPALVFVRSDSAAAVVGAVQAVPGVTGVRVLPADPAAPPTPAAPPKVVDGRVQIQATLADPTDSRAAEDTVARIRVAAGQVPGADAVVGGFTAVNLDTRIASVRDRNVIIPVVLLVIGLILAVLLRALAAPMLLIASVVLSFAATLGLCALLFTTVFGFASADPSFPLFAFVFLVALGIDYNIFLMSRVREEAGRRGTREGVLRGLVVTGGVITSAGVVLAATFSALAVLPLVVLVELGVVVAVGVLLDTTVVRSLLVPALVHDIGRRTWWPGRLSKKDPQIASIMKLTS